ncbi:MAG: prepilin-type N-terminal cleavage/methylation domain-containing protein [Chitinispirillaceae bacterium]|nr:prepilin-type N-terminal cleavage/methylation domain-containing protein [Chitinispirillaceae bacterium]
MRIQRSRVKGTNSSAATYYLKKYGFTIMEILLVLIVIGIIGVNVLVIQSRSWKQSGSSNRLLIAGQLIEKQVERLRMHVDRDPDNNYPPGDSSITENGVTLSWELSPAQRLVEAVELANVRRCDLTASWGTAKNDTLKVTTFIAKNF